MVGCRRLFGVTVLLVLYGNSFFAPTSAEDEISKRILDAPENENLRRSFVKLENKNDDGRFDKTRFKSRRRIVFDASKIDLVFVVDNSFRVGQTRFNREKRFLKDLIGYLPVFPNKIRIASVSVFKIEFNFKKYHNKECTIKGIHNIKYTGGQSSLGRALDLARMKLMFNPASGARDNAQKIMVVFTDGNLGDTARILSNKMKGRGVEIITVAVTGRSRTEEHLSIANEQEYGDTLNQLFTWFGGDTSRRCLHGKFVHDECGRRCKCVKGKLVQCCRVRKQFTEMSIPERARYVKVIKTASTHPAYKESYEKLLTVHKTLFNTAIHQAEFFLPWHRWFILQFENLLRQIDCSITVPFWESTEEANDALASNVWDTGIHGFGGNGSGTTNCVRDGPFRAGEWSVIASAGGGCLTRNFNGRFPDCLTVRDAFLEFADESEFDDFEYFLHREFHDAVHCVIGGHMCTDNSASSPEFFLHHGFVDKLWYDWQKQSARHMFAERYMSQTSRMPSSAHLSRDFLDLSDQPGCVCVQYRDPGDEIYTTVNGFTKEQVKEIPRVPLPPYPENAKKLFKVTDGDMERLLKIRQFLQPVHVLRENALEGQNRALGFRKEDVERVDVEWRRMLKGSVSSEPFNFRRIDEDEETNDDYPEPDFI